MTRAAPLPAPFLSVVVVHQNGAAHLEGLLTDLLRTAGPLVGDLQLLVVDNASQDDSVAALQALTRPGGLPNLQVLALGAAVDPDTAAWAGLDRALGDLALVIDPVRDDASVLPELLRLAGRHDLVYVHDRQAHPGLRGALRRAFFRLYRLAAGVDLSGSPRFRLIHRRVLTFIHQHPVPAAAYRALPGSAGFSRVTFVPTTDPRALPTDQPTRTALRADLSQAWALLMRAPRGPTRLVTGLSLVGAAVNLAYSLYVILVALFKAQVQPGWVTLSLQQSGMFLLLSLTLAVLGESIALLTRQSHQGPGYTLTQEFTSTELGRQTRLNVQEEAPAHVQEEAPAGHLNPPERR